jgi:Lon protease-like protein
MSIPTETVRVNFARPMPLFPLHQAILMPHGFAPLHIFETRYRRMVRTALDGSGQIAMAVFEGGGWKTEYRGRPPIRGAVCIGHIVQHQSLPDGRYHILLQGICRARIVMEMPELEGGGDAGYRTAMLELLGDPGENRPASDAPVIREMRTVLAGMFEGPLKDVRESHLWAEHLRGDQVPTGTLMELLSLALVSDAEQRYKLLAAETVEERAGIITREFKHLAALIRRAAPQRTVTGTGKKEPCWN